MGSCCNTGADEISLLTKKNRDLIETNRLKSQLQLDDKCMKFKDKVLSKSEAMNIFIKNKSDNLAWSHANKAQYEQMEEDLKIVGIEGPKRQGALCIWRTNLPRDISPAGYGIMVAIYEFAALENDQIRARKLFAG